MHDDLQRAGRRRLILTAVAGVALMSGAVALLVFPAVLLTVAFFVVAAGRVHASADVLRAVAMSAGIGVIVASFATAFAWRNAERDALRSTDLQLATVPGSDIRVVPSWRVADGPLPYVRRALDTLS